MRSISHCPPLRPLPLVPIGAIVVRSPGSDILTFTSPPRCEGLMDELRGTCRKPGCMNTTAERKPVCSEHILSMPYAALVREEVDRREVVAQSGRVSEDSTVIADVLMALGRCPAPLSSVATSVGMNVHQFARVVRVLERRGLVRSWMDPGERGRYIRYLSLA